jgi:hypothetical protein
MRACPPLTLKAADFFHCTQVLKHAQSENGRMQHEMLRNLDFPSDDDDCLQRLAWLFRPRASGLQLEVVQLA